MKIGDSVYLKKQFRVVDFSYNQKIMVIEILEDLDINRQVVIPIFVNSFGINISGKNFALPGDNLPIDHPDYYEVITNLGDAPRVIRNNKKYELQFSKTFREDGTYWLIDEETNVPQKKTAQLLTEEEVMEQLKMTLNYPMPGELIRGRVISIIRRNWVSQKLEILNYFSEVSGQRVAGYDYSAIIQDPETKIEYEIPAKLLTVK